MIMFHASISIFISLMLIYKLCRTDVIHNNYIWIIIFRFCFNGYLQKLPTYHLYGV